MTNRPQEYKNISDKELHFIQSNLEENRLSKVSYYIYYYILPNFTMSVSLILFAEFSIVFLPGQYASGNFAISELFMHIH